jgi:hypothetical protein
MRQFYGIHVSDYETVASPRTVANLSGDRRGADPKVEFRAHDPEKHVLDMIGDGNRFSVKIMRD